MLLVGMIAGLNAVVLFTKLYGALRVAFEVDSFLEFIEINHCEDFIFNSKNKGAFVERQVGGYVFAYGLTGFKKFFDVHQS